LSPESRAAVDAAAGSLGVVDTVDIPGSDAARAAAYVITSVEAARERFTELRDRIGDFDPNTRYRFLAGAFLPADWYVKAQQFRRWYSRQLAGNWRFARCWEDSCKRSRQPACRSWWRRS
jgi:hypothetical protein